MRVILNGVSALKPKTGVGHTTVNLHRALVGQGGEDAFWLYPGEWAARLAGRALHKPHPLTPSPTRGGGTEPITSIRSPLPGSGRGLGGGVLTRTAKAAYRAHFRIAARWGRFDLVHEPNFVPVRTHLPTVVTVHDLSVLLYPEWHPADRVAVHDRHFRGGVASAAHVVVVSESVRREAVRELGLPPDRVTAIPNGISAQYSAQSAETVEAVQWQYGLTGRYLLAVGTIEPRKNIGTLLRAFCDLPAAVREACPLVLAGGWGWKSEPERELFESVGRDNGVRHLGYVADRDLPGLYAGAAALLYPSFYEGFGLPPVEMLACGGGVIASTAAAVREVVGRHAVLLDPHDLAGWRDAMRRAATEPGYLDETRRGGVAHARRYTWERAAGQTLGVYRRALGLERSIELRPAA